MNQKYSNLLSVFAILISLVAIVGVLSQNYQGKSATDENQDFRIQQVFDMAVNSEQVTIAMIEESNKDMQAYHECVQDAMTNPMYGYIGCEAGGSSINCRTNYNNRIDNCKRRLESDSPYFD